MSPLAKVFIKNFGANVERQDIEDAFAKFGDIYDSRFNATDRYATICYRQAECADKAIEKMNDSDVLGGKLKVEYTNKKSRYDDRDQQRQPYPRNQGYDKNDRSDRNDRFDRDGRSFNRSGRQDTGSFRKFIWVQVEFIRNSQRRRQRIRQQQKRRK